MRKVAGLVIALLLLVGLSIAQTNTATIYNPNSSGITSQPIRKCGTFKSGDIANYPQPVINSTPAATYQEWVTNRWADGSVKHACVWYLASISATSSDTVTFQNSVSGSHSGGLTYAQMKSFLPTGASTSYDAYIKVTPGAVHDTAAAVTVKLSDMLNGSDPTANTFGDGKNNVLYSGPLATSIVLQEGYQSGGTMHSQWDFGWKWDGTNMSSDSVNPSYTGTNGYATFHPVFIVTYYPSWGAGGTTKSIEVEYILEMPWTNRYQDQLADVELDTVVDGAVTKKYAQTGARKITDLMATNASHTITSATTNFASTDQGSGLAICQADDGTPAPNCGLSISGYAPNYEWYTLTSVTNATTALISNLNSTGTGYVGQTFASAGNCHTSGACVAYINLRASGVRPHKTFWIGTQPAFVRIDHNFAYLNATNTLNAYWDLSGTATVDPDFAGDANTGATSWAQWIANDHGRWLGWGGFNSVDFIEANNSEGGAQQRETLAYLYNMSSANSVDGSNCGTLGGKCAKAYAMLTGGYSANDGLTCNEVVQGSTVACKDAGGLGMYSLVGNYPYHYREGRTVATGNTTTGNSFYCSGFADINAGGDVSTCVTSGSVPNDATGKVYSVHAHSGDFPNLSGMPLPQATIPVGGGTVYSNPPADWSFGTGCDHVQDWDKVAWILTGDYYYYENLMMDAAFCVGNTPSYSTSAGANRTMGYISQEGSVIRRHAFGLQYVKDAASMAFNDANLLPTRVTCPDGTLGSPEKCYFQSVFIKNLQIEKGATGNTDASDNLLPTNHRTDCTSFSYNYQTANAYEWGRCSVMSNCITTGSACPANVPSPLHQINQGTAFTGGSTLGVGQAQDYATVTLVTVTGISCSVYPQGLVNLSGTSISSITTVQNSSGCTGTPTCTIYGSGSSGACTFNTGTNLFTVTNAGTGYGNVASAWMVPYQHNLLGFILSRAYWEGFTYAQAMAKEILSYPVERVMTNYNNNEATAVISLSAIQGMKAISGNSALYVQDASNINLEPFLTYSTLNDGLTTVGLQTRGFGKAGGNCPGVNCPCPGSTCVAPQPPNENIPCGNHGYSMATYMAVMEAAGLNLQTSQAACPGGTCKAADAKTYLTATHPYFGRTLHSCTGTGSPWDCTGAAVSDTCTALGFGDVQIMEAVVSQPSGATVTSCTLSPSSATIATGGTQAATATCMYSDGSGPTSCTSDLSLGTSNAGVASVSGQTITGVSAGSATITGTTISNSTVCTPTMSVTVTASPKMSITGGMKFTGGVVVK